MRIDRLEIGQRFRQTLDYDESRAPIVTTGRLLYKNPCRVLVQLDGAGRTRELSTPNGETRTFTEQLKPQSWACEAEVECLQ